MASPTIKPIQVGETVRYRWVVDIGADPVTGRRRQIRRTFDRRKDAQADLARVLHEVNRRTFTVPAKTTVAEYLREWLRSATRGKEAATARNYEDALRPVIDRYSAKPLQQLSTTDVENLVDSMLTSGRKRGGKPGTGLSPRTVQLTLSRLRSALTDAVNRHMLEWNPAAPVKCPSQVKTPREPWTEHEVRAFLSSLVGQRLHAIMLLALLGLRPAEVCGLRWPDIDLEAGTLNVVTTRTLVMTDQGMQVVEKAPK